MPKQATKSDASRSVSGSLLPAHEIIYRRLRDTVLSGELVPGQAVTIQGLSEKLDAGVTPVREAIRRLISLGALEFRGNRRVSVPILNPECIDEIMTARQWLDPHLASLATGRVTASQVEELTALDASLDQAIRTGDLHGYLTLNCKFHHGIYEIAKSPILADMASNLWLRFGPSLRVVCGRVGTENQPDRHKELLQALRDGNAAAAAASMHEDVVQGMDAVKETLLRMQMVS